MASRCGACAAPVHACGGDDWDLSYAQTWHDCCLDCCGCCEPSDDGAPVLDAVSENELLLLRHLGRH